MVFSIAIEWVGGRQLQTGLDLKKISIKIERERERPRSLPSICYVFPQSMGAYWVVENVGIF